MHADSLLVHLNFSSKLMITWLEPTFRPLSNWSKTPSLVRTGPKLSLRTIHYHVIIKCPKTHFWSTFISSKWTKTEFSISLKADQKWVWVTWSLISKRNWGGPKVSLHVYASRDSPPSHTLLNQKLDPRVMNFGKLKKCFVLNFMCGYRKCLNFFINPKD